MNISSILLTLVVAIILLFTGTLVTAPFIFAGRVPVGVSLGGISLSGVALQDVADIVQAYQVSLASQTVRLRLGDYEVTPTLADIGIYLDQDATTHAIQAASLKDAVTNRLSISPTLQLDHHRMRLQTQREFADYIDPPQNASLTLSTANELINIPSRAGESIELQALLQDLTATVSRQSWDQPIELAVIVTPAEVQDDEVAAARDFAQELIREGIMFAFHEQTYEMKPYTLQRLLTFTEQVDLQDPTNMVLGVQLDPVGFADYLQKSITPAINQEPQNARFSLETDQDSLTRATQFALPQIGQQLNISRTASHTNAKLAQHERTIPLAVEVVSPDIAELDDIEQLGLTSLLATGRSDFSGSPNNRVHNITVGTNRYHGLLIPPGTEFSFNEFLGPVDGLHGFLPELVIKQNVTTPEYGGGLCQVSTTAFRAALNAGLEITDRRNHSYAVSYYGKPGLDATIYPPYTDLRFLNNTPSFILIQTRIEADELIFEFWGTDDGRQVDLVEHFTYDQQSNGALKAQVTQKVTREGKLVIDETFYSRYKSPKLFPKVLGADDPKTAKRIGVSPSSVAVEESTTANGTDHATKQESKPTGTISPSPQPPADKPAQPI